MSLPKTNIAYTTRSAHVARGCANDGVCALAEGQCWALNYYAGRGRRLFPWATNNVDEPTLCRTCHGQGPCPRCYGSGRFGTHKATRWSGEVRVYPEVIESMATLRGRHVVFVGSMTDLALADEETIRLTFGTALCNPTSQWLFLTKRPRLLLEKLREGRTHTGQAPIAAQQVALTEVLEGHRNAISSSHLWVGVSASTQAEYDERVGALCDRETGWPGKKWVSLEPCMEEIDLGQRTSQISWCVVGSADTLTHSAAALAPEIARGLRDQAEAARVPFWLKQAFWNDEPGDRSEGVKINAPFLDGRQHLAAPAPIAAILRERGKLT